MRYWRNITLTLGSHYANIAARNSDWLFMCLDPLAEKTKMKKRPTSESGSAENVEDLLPERSDGKIDSPVLIFNPQFLDLWREVTEYTYERLVSEFHNDSAEASRS